MINSIENKQKLDKILSIAKIVFYALLIITGIILMFWILKFVYTKFFKPNSEILGTTEYTNNQHLKTIDSDKNIQLSKGAKLSYPKSFYHELADSMHEKMNSFFSAPYSEMYPLIIKMHNYLDLLELQTAYGLRDFGVGFEKSVDLTTSIEKYSDDKTNVFWKAYLTSISKSKILTK